MASILFIIGSILSLIVPVGIAVAVVMILRHKMDSPLGGEQDPIKLKLEADKMIRTVYIYIVLLATLLMTIGGSVAAFMATADIIAPAPYYQSYQDFKQSYDSRQNNNNNGTEVRATEEELKADYTTKMTEERERTRQQGINSLIQSFGWIIIPFPIFLFHQRKIKMGKGSEI